VEAFLWFTEIYRCLLDAKIAWSLIEGVPEILGRANVFDKFDIELKQAEGISVFRGRAK